MISLPLTPFCTASRPASTLSRPPNTSGPRQLEHKDLRPANGPLPNSDVGYARAWCFERARYWAVYDGWVFQGQNSWFRDFYICRLDAAHFHL